MSKDRGRIGKGWVVLGVDKDEGRDRASGC